MAVNEHFVGDPFEIDPEEVVADEDLGCIEVEDGALDGIEEPELPLEDCAPPSPVASNSDDDSSSSASDVSAEPMDLVGVLPEQDTDISLQWFQQGAKVHVVRLIPDEGPKIPWCRDRPFPQDPAKVGEGFSTVLRAQLCQRCLARMPRATYAALAEQCAWSH